MVNWDAKQYKEIQSRGHGLFQEIQRNSSASSHTQPWPCLLSTGRSTDSPVFGYTYYIHRDCKRRVFSKASIINSKVSSERLRPLLDPFPALILLNHSSSSSSIL